MNLLPSLLRRNLVVHVLYKILPDNLKAMPAEEASMNLIAQVETTKISSYKAA
jgi:hypothetical protein